MSRSWRVVLPAVSAAVVVAALVFLTLRAGGDGVPTLADRTMAIAAGLRCPVCAGQSVAASSSAAAAQMRGEIRRQLAQGRTADQIRSWFAARYGSQVLMTPPPSGIGLVAWLAPFALLALGAILLVRTAKNSARDDLEGLPTP